MDRAQRLLDDRRIECVERAYLRYASGLRSIFTGGSDSETVAFALECGGRSSGLPAQAAVR